MRERQWKKLFGLWLIITLLVVCLDAHATNHYIRQGAAGANNGTDWTNAWTAQPGTWVRGDTYYYADGEINEYIIMDVADQGTDRITLKKATSADHGTETGWSAGYGDGQFHFTATTRIMLLWSSYVTIDGVTGGGPGSWTTGFGFKFSIPDSTDGDNFGLLDFTRATPVTNVILAHIEFKQAGMDNWESVGDGYYNRQRCIFFNRVENTTLSYCYLHDANQAHILASASTDMIIEYNYFEHRSGAPHGESISWNGSGTTSNNIFRYNIFKDNAGTGVLVAKDSIQGGMLIHNNVFYSTDNVIYYQTNAYVCNTGGDTNNDMVVINNTFYNLTPDIGGIEWSIDGGGNITQNNLFHGCGEVNLDGTLDNNASENVGVGSDDCEYDLDAIAANVFVSVTPGSVDLTPLPDYAGQDVGSDFSDIFTTDLAGNPIPYPGWSGGRISGILAGIMRRIMGVPLGLPDIGAYECSGGSVIKSISGVE